MNLEHLGVNVRCYRQLLGLSQHDLAARAGDHFSQSYLSRLERGLRPNDHHHVNQIAAALGVSADALLRRPRVVRQVSKLRPAVLLTGSTPVLEADS